MAEERLAHILVVVFDTLQRDLIVMALNRGTYRPVICEDLAQIRPLIKEHQPAVLLIDLYLPGTNGLELLKDLSREGLLKQRSTIVISAMGFPEIINQVIALGVDDFLVKPIYPDLLLARIQRVVNKNHLS